MNRVTARTHAMKLIYEWEMGGEGGEDTRIDLSGRAARRRRERLYGTHV